MSHGRSRARPLLFGELLFDHFPDGRAVLGGAPFNVAWHLEGFGLKPLLISRIGEDVPGEWALQAMRNWGMDTAGIQRDLDHPTGCVQVRFRGEEPEFRIIGDQAYDHVQADEALQSIEGVDVGVLYHGTLAARSPESRHAMEAVRGTVLAPLFIDANLRAPWWDAALIDSLLSGARWLKLSRGELAQLADGPTLLAAARELRARYDLLAVIVTEGDGGAHYVTAHERFFEPALPADPLVNAVGAGDAFSAVCIVGIFLGWTPADTLRRAGEFAAHVCTLPGAICQERDIYTQMRRRWGS